MRLTSIARAESAARVAWPFTVCVPGGRFLMGCDDGRPDERPVHAVEVEPFEVGVTPVTCAQFAWYVHSTGAPAPPSLADPAFAHPQQPVTSVTWFEAAAYAEWLSARRSGRWRLPTEAEWERAARGGLEGRGTPWGDQVPDGEVPQGLLDGPWRVARGTPNGYGLFDVGTLVHEWCADWYAADAYASPPRRDPRGPRDGTRRVSRGGSWRHHVRWSSPAARSSLPPAARYNDYGFRVVKETPP